MKNKQTHPIAIVGGGPAGMEAAGILAETGYPVALFEAKSDWADNLNNKYKIFPDFSSADDLLNELKGKIEHSSVSKFLNTGISGISRNNDDTWNLKDRNGNEYTASAVLISNGYAYSV